MGENVTKKQYDKSYIYKGNKVNVSYLNKITFKEYLQEIAIDFMHTKIKNAN
jgi:hypothetical protein